MTRQLVRDPVDRLDKKKANQLLDQVKAWEKADKDHYLQMVESKKMLEGEQWPELKADENRVTANLAFAQFKSSVPFIFFREPTIRCKPRNVLQVGKEQLWDGIYKYTLPLIEYQKYKRKQVEDTWLYGEGWGKWVVDTHDNDESEGKTVLTEVAKGPAMWHNKGLPVLVRLNPLQVIVDTLAIGRDPDEARAIAVKYRKPLSEILANPLYEIDEDLIDRNMIEGNQEPSMKQGDTSFADTVRENLANFLNIESGYGSAERPMEEMATIYEVWVYQLVDYQLYRQLVVLMDGYDGPIMQPKPWENFVGKNFPGWPVRRMVFNTIPDSNPKNTIQLTKDLQKAFNWVLSKLINHLDTISNVRLVDKSKLVNAKKTMRRLRGGKSLEYVQVKEAGAIENLQYPPFPRDAYSLADIVQTLIDQIGQGSKNRSGQIGARTATEASIVEKGQQTMDDDTTDIVQKDIHLDMEQLGVMLTQLLSPDQLIRIAGDTGQVDFDTVREMDLDYVPEITVEADSFRKLSIQEKLQPWMQIWGLALQAITMMPDLRLDIILARIGAVLDIDTSQFLGDVEDQRVAELFDIMSVMQEAQESGGRADAPIPENANAFVRKQMLEFFMTTELYKRLGRGLQSLLINRQQRYESMIQQAQDAYKNMANAPRTGNNPLDQGLMGGEMAPDAATRARSRTAKDRQMLQPGPRGVVE